MIWCALPDFVSLCPRRSQQCSAAPRQGGCPVCRRKLAYATTQLDAMSVAQSAAGTHSFRAGPLKAQVPQGCELADACQACWQLLFLMVECWQAGSANDARAQLQQLCYLLILMARWPIMLEQPLSSAVTAMG
jgi:hypothetical protein